jgi:hypothetical protein
VNYCEYASSCNCEYGYQEVDCNQVVCGEPAAVKIDQHWYCDKHGDRMQAISDRHKKAKN